MTANRMPSPHFGWKLVGAAAFVLGVMIGPSVLRSSQPLPLVSEGGRVVATGALDATREAAQAQVDQAQRCLSVLPSSEWREALLQLSFDSIHRSS